MHCAGIFKNIVGVRDGWQYVGPHFKTERRSCSFKTASFSWVMRF